MANAKKTTMKKKSTEKKMTEKEILKQLQDPKISKAKKNILVEKLWKDIPVR